MDAVMLARKVAATQHHVITAEQARMAGMTKSDVDGMCRAGRWRRLARGAYLVEPDLQDGALRRARIQAAVSSLGPGATAVLHTAAELHCIAGLPRTDDVHVSLAGPLARMRRPTDPGLVVHQLVVPPSAVTTMGGISATNPVRTVADLILQVNRYDAVCLLDSALNRGLVSPEEFLTIPALIAGRRGAVAARTYLPLADGRSQSPLETRVRLRCVDGNIAPDTLQHPVRDAGGVLLGVADLAWLAAKLFAEADGQGPHSLPQPIFHDRVRQNLLVNEGWLPLRFTWADTLRRSYIPDTVRAAQLSRRRRR